MSREVDRARILRRRAAFIGSALAALGCSRGSPPAKGPAPSGEPHAVVSVPRATDEEPPGEVPPAAAERPKPPRSTPPLEVPEGVSEQARERFVRLATQMNEIYDFIDGIEVPERCDVTDAGCESAWRKLAEDLLDLEQKSRWIRSPCKGSSEAAKLHAQRAEQHAAHVAALRQEIAEKIESLIAAGGKSAQEGWAKIERDARRARPVVCLSFGCVDW
jgi:hypothetical protein